MISKKSSKRIKLYVHIYPCTECDWDCIKFDKQTLHFRQLTKLTSCNYKTCLPKFKSFQTDGIFSNCCQSEVYATVRDEIMESVLQGIDHVVMSYGQNNSGKTFTLSGLHNRFELRGLLPRFMADLFKQKEAMKDMYSFKISISAVDIYKNSIFDLLSKTRRFCKNTKEFTVIQLKSLSHCFNILFKAESERKCLNNKSYNSHLGSYVVTFIVKLKPLMSQNSLEKLNKIHFIDLAGVETVERNQSTSFKDQQSQGDANVTKSLLELFALRCKNYKNVEVRDMDHSANLRAHILTKYLGNSFSQTSAKTFICNIRPKHEDLMITLSLMKFGMAFKSFSVEKPDNILYLDCIIKKSTEYFEEQIEIIRERNIPGMGNNLKGNNCLVEISQDRIDFIKRLVQLFIKEEISEVELTSIVNDHNLVLDIMKNIIREKSETTNMATQTDFNEKRLSSFNNNASQQLLEKNNKPSLSKEPSPIHKESIKNISFKNVGKVKGKKLVKDNKSSAKKVKSKDKGDLKCTEVQVNLVESKFEMPTIGSREYHWSLFLIESPETQTKLDKLISNVSEKYKIMNISKLKHEEVKRNLMESQLTVNKLECLEYIKSDENNFIKQEEVNNWFDDLKSLEKEVEMTRQSVINSQIEYLDATQVLNDTKQTIEKEFAEFCRLNNVVALEIKNEVSDDIEPEKSKEIITETKRSFCSLQDIYNTFQMKYIHKYLH